MLGADDSLDVFGVHGVGGIVGALLTGVFNTQALGGPGLVTDWVTATVGRNGIGAQVWIQLKAVLLTIVWSGVVALVGLQDRRPGDRTARQRGRGARGPGHHLARRDRLSQVTEQRPAARGRRQAAFGRRWAAPFIACGLA